MKSLPVDEGSWEEACRSLLQCALRLHEHKSELSDVDLERLRQIRDIAIGYVGHAFPVNDLESAKKLLLISLQDESSTRYPER